MDDSTPHHGGQAALPGLVLPEHLPVPARFRLDERTRRIGRAGVAAARELLEAQAARRAELEVRRTVDRPVRVRSLRRAA